MQNAISPQGAQAPEHGRTSNDAPPEPESRFEESLTDFEALARRIKALEDRNAAADEANNESRAMFMCFQEAQISSSRTPRVPPNGQACQ